MELSEGRGCREHPAEWQMRERQDRDRCAIERRQLPVGTELPRISASFKCRGPGCGGLTLQSPTRV